MFIDLSLSMVFYHYLSAIPIYCMNGQYSFVFFFFFQNQNYLYFLHYQNLSLTLVKCVVNL